MIVTVRKAQTRLLAVWGIGFGLVLVVAVSKTFFGHLGDSSTLWRWMAARLTTPVSLMLGTLVGHLTPEIGKSHRADGRLFLAAIFLSCAYLLLVLVALIAGTNWDPSALSATVVPAEFLLGFVMLCLGAYFARRT
ncbi:MAG TPA: hypothetical protein VMT19_03805 [Thermoanaerobaculaceae bacterium]|nr:hypothetical protein [Thermoanaerobaculaceae bacterium]